MAQEKQRTRVAEGRRRSVFVGIFSLLPMLVVAGMLAPKLVRVTVVEAEPMNAVPVPVSRRASRHAHQPMLLPLDFSAEWMPELFDLEHLFSRVETMSDPIARDHAGLPNYPSKIGDVIALDDIDRRIPRIAFEDTAPMGATTDFALPPLSADLLPPRGSGPIGPGRGHESRRGPRLDPAGEIVVPEPSTGLLVGMGLALLGVIHGSGRARRT